MTQRRWILLLLSLVVMCSVLAYLGGKRAAIAGLSNGDDSVHSLRLQVTRLEDELNASRGQLEMLQTRHEVDRQAQEFLRLEIAGNKEQVAEVREALLFYRSFMSPDDIASGLSIRAPELVRGEEPGTVAFRVVVQQKARQHKLIEGRLSIDVVGKKNGEKASYPLSELSQAYSEDAMKLEFRYFQRIEGEFELPPGFEPSGMSVIARTTKPEKAEVGQIFRWKLQERMTHVGE